MRGRDLVLFDVEVFDGDFILFLAIPGYEPLLIQNPSKRYVMAFMRGAKIHPNCIIGGVFWDLYKYLYSITWLDLLTNNKEVKICLQKLDRK